MQSKHAFILALMSGAGALLVVLGVLLSVALVKTAGPYLTGHSNTELSKTKSNAPLFATKLEGSSVQIVETDKDGNVLRTVLSSDPNDLSPDFSLFAVPQTRYDGKVYVESVQDAAGTALIIYPLDVVTGKLSQSTLNVVSTSATVSPEQDRVAVINTTQVKNITAYDIISGATLASWTLDADERLNEAVGYAHTYSGTGVHWINNNCFDHPIWTSAGQETRTFCLEDGN